MATHTHQVHSVTLPNESLRLVRLWSEQDRAPSTSAHYGIRVGVARGDDTDWLAEYDGSVDQLTAREPMTMTGSSNVDLLLIEEDALVVEVTKTGSPAESLTGLTIEIQMNLVGGDSERPGALFSAAGITSDTRTRAALDGLVAQLNRSGTQSWTISVPLVDPDTAPSIEASDLADNDDQTITAGGALEDTQVSLTFTLPSGKVTGYVNVTGAARCYASGGTGEGFLAMEDGTTAHNEINFTIETARGGVETTGFAGSITATTTFTLQARSSTNNMVLDRSLIWGSCIWT